MTEAERDSLATLFGLTLKAENGKQELKGDAVDTMRTAVKDAFKEHAPALIAIPGAQDKAVSCLSAMLHTRIRDIVVSAWNKRKEIAKYSDVQKYPPGQKHYVQLYEHPITWTYRPTLVITVSKATHRIPLELKVVLEVDQAVLVIEGGRVMAIEPGTGKLEGSAKLGSFKLLDPIEKDLGKLPGSLSFAPDGFPLRRADH